MSSSEEYLDSLLDSILSGGKSDEEEKSVSEESQTDFAENRSTDAGKAMSPDEIEEMLVSMGTLSGEEEGAKEQDSEEDMEAMLASMDELSLDELSLDGLSSEEAGGGMSDGLDDLVLDDLSLDDLDMVENSLEEPSMDEASLDDLSLDELSLDGLISEEAGDGMLDGLDDLALDDLSLDNLDMEESGSEELSMDGMSLDEMSLDELSLGGLDAEEAGGDASDDFAIDEMSLNDFNEEEDADGLMSEEDIDRLLNGDMSTEEETAEDFALEETQGEGDDDLSALLAGMEHDEDLSEINDLLEESDQGVPADDDMLAMLAGASEDGSFDLFESDDAAREAEGIRELSPEEVAEREGSDGEDKKEKKKRKKLFGKKKKGGEEGAGDELDALLGEGKSPEESKEEKKPGFLARLMDFLLESDEDDDPLSAEILAGNGGEMGNVTDENKELLQELSDEDKKGKKKKKKKDKKGKKDKEGEEDAKKAKKPKKEKKKKEKKKKEEDVDLLAPPEKKLSKKKVITAFLFSGTVGAAIIVCSMIVPDTIQKREAHTAYDQGEYAQVYDLLYGKELDEEDEVIFQGSNLVMQLNRKLSSYDNYIKLDMRMEALNALITGVERYQQILPEAENYNVIAEVNDIYSQILERLSAFGLSEGDAWDILMSEDNVAYTHKLQAIINGEAYGVEEAEEGVPDILPEEEEIIERIDGIEGEAETGLEPEKNALEETEPETQASDESAGENADEGAE